MARISNFNSRGLSGALMAVISIFNVFGTCICVEGKRRPHHLDPTSSPDFS